MFIYTNTYSITENFVNDETSFL